MKGKAASATRPDNHRTLPCAEEIAAMGQRNRAALDKARAEGADTWLREEFNCAGDGVMRAATRCVPVPPLDDGGEHEQKSVAADGITFYDHFAKSEAEHSAAVRALPPVARRAYATYLRTGRLPEARARAPREARNDRPRGSRRSSARRSSRSAGTPRRRTR